MLKMRKIKFFLQIKPKDWLNKINLIKEINKTTIINKKRNSSRFNSK